MQLSSQLINHGHGLCDVSMASCPCVCDGRRHRTPQLLRHGRAATADQWPAGCSDNPPHVELRPIVWVPGGVGPHVPVAGEAGELYALPDHPDEIRVRRQTHAQRQPDHAPPAGPTVRPILQRSPVVRAPVTPTGTRGGSTSRSPREESASPPLLPVNQRQAVRRRSTDAAVLGRHPRPLPGGGRGLASTKPWDGSRCWWAPVSVTARTTH